MERAKSPVPDSPSVACLVAPRFVQFFLYTTLSVYLIQLLNLQEPPPPEPLTYLEQKRKEAQAHYREDQAYIAKNREQFDKLLEEDRNAAAAQMSGSLWSVVSGIAGGPPPAPHAGAGSEGQAQEQQPPAARSKTS